MTIVRPDGFRSTITDDEVDGFRVTIPVQRSWPLIIFLGVWLCGWAFGELTVSGTLIGSTIFGVPKMKGQPAPQLIMLFWLTIWTIGGGVVIYILLWQLTGQEVIRLDDRVLEIRREVARLTRSRTFDLANVRNLRFSPPLYNPWNIRESWRTKLKFVGLDAGSIAFDYGAGTHRFGSSLSELESRRLIKTIRERFKIEDDPIESLPVRT
jgi:hypothetical protein